MFFVHVMFQVFTRFTLAVFHMCLRKMEGMGIKKLIQKGLSFDEKRCTPTSIGFIMESTGPTPWIVVGFILVVNNPWRRPYLKRGSGTIPMISCSCSCRCPMIHMFAPFLLQSFDQTKTVPKKRLDVKQLRPFRFGDLCRLNVVGFHSLVFFFVFKLC